MGSNLEVMLKCASPTGAEQFDSSKASEDTKQPTALKPGNKIVTDMKGFVLWKETKEP